MYDCKLKIVREREEEKAKKKKERGKILTYYCLSPYAWDRSVRGARNNDKRPSRESTEAAHVFPFAFARDFAVTTRSRFLEIASSRVSLPPRGRALLERRRSREKREWLHATTSEPVSRASSRSLRVEVHLNFDKEFNIRIRSFDKSMRQNLKFEIIHRNKGKGEWIWERSFKWNILAKSGEVGALLWSKITTISRIATSF